MTEAASIERGSLRAWVLAARPQTLPVSMVPVAVGTAIAAARGGARPPVALACLGVSLLLQIAANLANDVFDFEKGADTAARLGPLRAAQAGLLTPRAMKVGLAVALALATATGLSLVLVGGWPVLALGALALLSAVAYTGGPYPLGYNGLGDVFVFGFFGVVAVVGTAALQTGAYDPVAFAAAAPIGALSTAVLVVNNVRDHETDVAAGKRTLVVRLGRRFGVAEYAALMLVAYATPLGLVGARAASPVVLLPTLTLPFAVRLCLAVAEERGAKLNARLRATAKLMVAFGALFAAGLYLGVR
ncbi:MAG: 1,4-dihydroxy-2-naphthoate polyprenyltransferase [Polyangiaceae bacterium]|nr:1,4-dihydroxy-2-naphthoate polyprenyltransferase [Polyangiaceae bacterium]